jgi:predicted alpha-1,6-mannanase (GH76 family)
VVIAAAVIGALAGYGGLRVAQAHATSGGTAASGAVPGAPPSVRAAVAVANLAGQYSGWTRSWREANAMMALAAYMQQTGSHAYLGQIADTDAEHTYSGFINSYYDDEGWWALAWVKAFDVTGNQRYLHNAQVIFANLTRGWTSTCGGGLLWKKGRPYKDAITNELFLEVAAQLHVRVPVDTSYQRWALRDWAWLSQSGMITKSGLVADGIDPATCLPVPPSTPAWTYNQGGLIGALVSLEQITHQRSLLRLAEKTAAAVIASPVLSPGGILAEPCEARAGCNQDAPTFKGIFVTNLKLLYDRVGLPRYLAYLRQNAASLWAHDRRGAAFGLAWGGPFDFPDTARQISAVDLLLTQLGTSQHQLAAGPPAAP